MINFASDTVFNLKPIDAAQVTGDVSNLFVEGEYVVSAYRTIRDQVVFTNRRIVTVDVRGLTGKRKDYSTLPYAKIQYFRCRRRASPKLCRTANWNCTSQTASRRNLSLRAGATSSK